MPKIIENLREKLLIEAKRQVFENGYSAMTIRSVASACEIGVGTVYNYFESKDVLIASFMKDDWEMCMETIQLSSVQNSKIEPVLRCIFCELKVFIEKYNILFDDKNAKENFIGRFQMAHKMLRQQIKKPLIKYCGKQEKVSPEFLAEFLAESMLSWVVSDRSYEEISSILLQLISENE